MSAVWMAAGVAVVATGALLHSATEPLRKRVCAPKGGLRGRRSPSTAISDALAVARRVEQIASLVPGLEARVEAMETGPIVERLEVLWQRVLKLEESLEHVATQRRETSALEMASEHTDNRLSPRLTSLETRVDEQHAAIQLLQAQASQMEATLQTMITAVARLADQILRAFPAAPPRVKATEEDLPGRFNAADMAAIQF